MKVLTNHLGYSTQFPKKAVIQCTSGEQPGSFSVLSANNRPVLEGKVQHAGKVAHWNKGDFWVADFSRLKEEGRYTISASGNNCYAVSGSFEVRTHLLTMKMLSAAGYYFKSQRSSGEWMKCDTCLPFKGGRPGNVDAHGGWYDATGDYGIHLSHLSHSAIYNPQQIPFSAYTFFKVHDLMEQSGNEQYSMVKRRMLDEGSFGADFLMRMQAPSGSFYRSINRKDAFGTVANSRSIGFEYRKSSDQFTEEASTADDETITDENYETSLRSGGGLAIAALAIAARHYYPSQEYASGDYINAAKKAWDHLGSNNAKYTNDGKWNLVDEYCALMAVTELYITTHEYDYLLKSRDMAERIYTRMEKQKPGMSRLYVMPGIPFHHASDEGMPVLALLNYAEMEPNRSRADMAITASEEIMRWKLAITDMVTNPFGYPRLETVHNGVVKNQFFFPHHSSAEPWWQGDNARIASIAAASCKLSKVTTDRKLADRCLKMAQDPLDWIMGLNPYDVCMIEGYGKNNISYFFNNRYDFLNCPGGIVNGITSGLEDEEGIEFITAPTNTVSDNWRWAEQWIPHASWYMYALAHFA
jgi:hypothetical protein